MTLEQLRGPLEVSYRLATLAASHRHLRQPLQAPPLLDRTPLLLRPRETGVEVPLGRVGEIEAEGEAAADAVQTARTPDQEPDRSPVRVSS